jgi:hypothetical protein
MAYRGEHRRGAHEPRGRGRLTFGQQHPGVTPDRPEKPRRGLPERFPVRRGLHRPERQRRGWSWWE